jgi:folate-binding protein YgfZ
VSGDLGTEYRALREEVGAVPVPRDAIAASGPQAVEYLQGQLSQDVAALEEGASALSLLLQPQGKVDAFLRVTRTGDDTMVLDVDGGWGEAVLARLARFRLRMKVDLEPLEGWRCLALRGPRASSVAAGGTAPLVAPCFWPGAPGVDLLGPSVEPPAGVRPCSPEALAAVRVEAGFPAMGSELGERTIPAEAGVVGMAVSFTKGCYTGQELVARIDARGSRVPRRLRGIVMPDGSDGEIPPTGAELVDGERVLGSLTTVAFSPGLGAPVALAYVRREVEPPARLRLRWEDGPGTVPAEVRALPLVG